jgi:hypothetical protein
MWISMNFKQFVFNRTLGYEMSSDDLRCARCKMTNLEAVVQHGSYILRCAVCKEYVIGTSWISVGPLWRHRVQVYADDVAASVPLLEGIGSEIAEQIGKMAEDGTTLVLRSVPEA